MLFTDVDDALIVLAAGPDHPGWNAAVAYLCTEAPEPIRSTMRQVVKDAAEAVDLELKPSGYLEDGTPVITLSAVAQLLGMSEEEVYQKAREIEAETGTPMLQPSSRVHRVQ